MIFIIIIKIITAIIMMMINRWCSICSCCLSASLAMETWFGPQSGGTSAARCFSTHKGGDVIGCSVDSEGNISQEQIISLWDVIPRFTCDFIVERKSWTKNEKKISIWFLKPYSSRKVGLSPGASCFAGHQYTFLDDPAKVIILIIVTIFSPSTSNYTW